eukprot:12447572-Ditylum_brightwellii.AAC.1
MKSWVIVKRTKGMNILGSTWAFKASAQIDYTASFFNTAVEEEIYVDMPQGYKKEGHILRLCRLLCVLKQLPSNFFNHLSDKLRKVGMVASKNDP